MCRMWDNTLNYLSIRLLSPSPSATLVACSKGRCLRGSHPSKPRRKMEGFCFGITSLVALGLTSLLVSLLFAPFIYEYQRRQKKMKGLDECVAIWMLVTSHETNWRQNNDINVLYQVESTHSLYLIHLCLINVCWFFCCIVRPKALTSSSFITRSQPLLPSFPPFLSRVHTTFPLFHAPFCASPVPCPASWARPSTTARPPCRG